MKRLSTAILAISIAVVFLLYMVTYTVGYNEIAIVTTFDRAKDADPQLLKDGKDTGSIMQEPGLKWKWPWPIQQVKTFPTQMQVLQDNPEQILLEGSDTVIINLTMAWRIEDPLAFFREFGDVEQAKTNLLSQMRDLRKIVSKVSLDQLVNPDKNLLRRELEGLEDRLVATIRKQLDETYDSGHGIVVEKVTLGKMLYTDSTIESVNKRMTATQQRLAQSIRSSGESDAKAIVAEAEANAKQLNEFAGYVATRIISEGKAEKAYYFKLYAESGNDPDFAIFLRQMETLEKTLASRTTFVLDARMYTPFNIFVYGHGKPGNLSGMFNDKEKGTAEPHRPTPLLPAKSVDATATTPGGEPK